MFKDILKEYIVENNSQNAGIDKTIISEITEEKNSADDILRSNGFKIKLVTPTSFGTQIDLFKTFEEEEVKEILKDFDIKIKNKSIFIID